jgi:adenylate cyclase
MTASSVLDCGGEVVSLIADAVLGLFRFEGAPSEACGRALAAAQEARRRLSTPQSAAADVAFDFGVSLHLGQVIYGNVGVPERLQFTLVGSAVNEVVRVQDLTKKLGYPLLTVFIHGAHQVGAATMNKRLTTVERSLATPPVTKRQRLQRFAC